MPTPHPTPSAIAALLHLDGNLSVSAGAGPAPTPVGDTAWVSPSGAWGQALQSSTVESPLAGVYDLNNSDFTLECRVWCSDNSSTYVGLAIASAGSLEYGFSLQGAGADYYDVSLVFAGYSDFTTVQFNQSTWVHLALTRQNNTLKLWVNGVAAYTSSSTDRLSVGPKKLRMWADNWSTLGSAIEEVCVTRTCLYTATFSPPSDYYSATANSALLHPASSAIVALFEFDGSNASSAGPIGSLIVSPAQADPFAYSAPFGAWGQSLIAAPNNLGYSSNDYRSREVGYESTTFGSSIFSAHGNWTLEGRLGTYSISLAPPLNEPGITVIDAGAGVATIRIVRQPDATHGNVVKFTFGNTTFTYPDSSGLTFRHVAATRQGTTIRFFVDGTLVHSFTTSVTAATYNGRIDIRCRRDDSNCAVDYLCLSSTCLYTANFTVPATPYSGLTYTSSLLVGSESPDVAAFSVSTLPPLCPDVSSLYSWTAVASTGLTVSNGAGSPTVEVTSMAKDVDTGEITMIGTRTGWPTLTWKIFVMKTKLLPVVGTVAAWGPVHCYAYGLSSATARIIIRSDGRITSRINGVPSETDESYWYGPTTSGIGSSHWAKLTKIAGSDPTGPTLGSILSLSAGLTISLVQNSLGSADGTYLVEIYSDSGGTTKLGQGEVYLAAEIS